MTTTPTVMIAPGVLFSRQPACNRYVGAPEAIVAAGLVADWMIPLRDGLQASYYVEGVRKGLRVTSGRRCGVRAVKLVRKADGVVADFDIPPSEARQRRQALEAQREREAAELAELAKRWPFPPPEHWMSRAAGVAPTLHAAKGAQHERT